MRPRIPGRKVVSAGLARALASSVILLVVAAGGLFARPPNKPGPASNKIYFRAFDVDRAVRDLEAGNMDLYMYSLKTEAAQRLQGDNRFNLYQAPASTVSLLLNPAPAPQGELNPFSIKEVRQAMQYLVDRNFIANDIYKGLAYPMITSVSPQDYDYLTVFDIAKGSGIGYDPEYGRQMITEAMQKAGAKMQGGVWTYDGEPVRIKLIGRVEDERRNIADLVRTELQKAGFTVEMSYLPFAAAVNTVYSSDPATLSWQIYTEGWGRSAPQRYDYANINEMSAPWLGNMPGWQEMGYWQYTNPQLDTLGKELFRGQFKSESQRDEIYRKMTQIALDESVRIWLVTVENTFPANKDVKGITADPVAGVRSPWSLREAYVPGKSTLTVGDLWVWTERTAWNPIGGMTDVYSNDIWRYLWDPPIWNNPFSGIPQPVRVDYRVTTAGPNGKLPVPSDAVTWNADTNKWVPVKPGTEATSKVLFDYSRYFSSKWHDGQPITMADVIYSIAQSYELAYDKDKTRIEMALGVTSRPFLETFKGFRIVDNLRLEVYVDYWHFNSNLIASYANPSSLSMPWELLAAMDDVVFNQRRGAYSDTAAARFNVPWLSLVMDRDARLVYRTLRNFKNSGFVPKGYFQVGNLSLVSPSQADAGYQAAMDWFDKTGNLIISNGPFTLQRYDPAAQFAELDAFRDPTYPYRPGQWDFGTPPKLSIDKVSTTTINAGRSADIDVSLTGPGKLGVRYLLYDPAARQVVVKGDARPGGGSNFVVSIGSSITGKLFPGLYSMTLLAYSNSLATVTEKDLDIEVK